MEFLNVWVLGVPMVSVEIKNDRQREVYNRTYSGMRDADVLVVKQDCPQAPIERIEV